MTTYNITTYGDRQTNVHYNDPAKARAYLKRKANEGFVLMRDVNGNQSEYALAVFGGRCNICIVKSQVRANELAYARWA